MHLLPQKHPKSLKIPIWDAFVPLKTSQIFKNPDLGYSCIIKASTPKIYDIEGLQKYHKTLKSSFCDTNTKILPKS